ncbi:MAG: hypothetical protein GY866_06210, partial [Proteobacteria bacterium]|nr:hypothetical protein [Pseudomonadota bacterium]
SERNILSDLDGQVTFRYRNGETDAFEYRTLPGPRFVALILQHLVLLPRIRDQPVVERPAFVCSICGGSMHILAVRVFYRRMEKNSRSPPLRPSPESVS